jgi:hypothetical protein
MSDTESTAEVQAAEEAAAWEKVQRAAARRDLALLLLVLALAGWLGFMSYRSGEQATDARAETAAVQGQAKSLADQIAEACAKGGTTAAELGPACAKAAEVQRDPSPPPRDGRDGEPGPRGPQGPTGSQGPQGPTGASGPTGAPGPVGADGPAGPVGAAGTPGEPGPQGPQGVPGQQGQPGVDGAPGPTCPTGYEPRPALIVGPDGSTYQGVACVDPSTSTAPRPGKLGRS